MKRSAHILTLLLAIIILSSCGKSYTCTCAGGVVFEVTEKEVKARNEKKAREKCEAGNQLPTSPDIVNCWLDLY